MNTIKPFGYFRALPLGWEDCAETDEGAVALYDQDALEAARQEEREACAKLCDEERARRIVGTSKNTAKAIAEAIRARNEDQEQTK